MNANYNDNDGTEAGSPPTKPKRWPWIVGIAAALLVGAGIGNAGADTEPTKVAGSAPPKPEVVTETVTETVEVEVTPDACIVAVDTAEVVFGIAGEFAGYTSQLAETASEAVYAAAVGDYVTIESLTNDVLAINDGIDGLTADLTPLVDVYNASAAECRAAGR